jgi:hypothetical protein
VECDFALIIDGEQVASRRPANFADALAAIGPASLFWRVQVFITSFPVFSLFTLNLPKNGLFTVDGERLMGFTVKKA